MENAASIWDRGQKVSLPNFGWLRYRWYMEFTMKINGSNNGQSSESRSHLPTIPKNMTIKYCVITNLLDYDDRYIQVDTSYLGY